MILDEADSLRLSITGEYAPDETALAKEFVRSGDVVLDIGAHIGYFTLLLSGLVGETGKVFAFEPDPANYDLLVKNIELNKLKNVIAVQKAIGNNNEIMPLYLSTENTRYHNVYNWDDDAESVDVEMIRLDDYFRQYPDVTSVDFIKMDIQGSEGEAIKGAAGILKNSHELKMITEFAPSFLNGSGLGPRGYLELLMSHGFCLRHADDQRKSIQEKDFDGLSRVYYTTLLCVKNDTPIS